MLASSSPKRRRRPRHATCSFAVCSLTFIRTIFGPHPVPWLAVNASVSAVRRRMKLKPSYELAVAAPVVSDAPSVSVEPGRFINSASSPLNLVSPPDAPQAHTRSPPAVVVDDGVSPSAPLPVTAPAQGEVRQKRQRFLNRLSAPASSAAESRSTDTAAPVEVEFVSHSSPGRASAAASSAASGSAMEPITVDESFICVGDDDDDGDDDNGGASVSDVAAPVVLVGSGRGPRKRRLRDTASGTDTESLDHVLALELQRQELEQLQNLPDVLPPLAAVGSLPAAIAARAGMNLQQVGHGIPDTLS
jgi:hypothetical protein